MKKRNKVSIVVPVYYNAESLEELYARVVSLIESNPSMDLELIFVDDGSGDNSREVIKRIVSQDERVVGLSLSRNFGAFNACLAGLTHCTGDCAVIISADLQDPPELIGDMYAKWRQGVKVVMAVRERREEHFIKIACAKIYYRLFRLLINNNMPHGGFDFVLIDRLVINAIARMQEKNTTLMGLILWSGFSREEILYTRRERKHGKSRWTLVKKMDYFIDSMLAFSKLPIRFFSIIGLFAVFMSFIGIIYVVAAYFLGWMTVAGWPSLMVVTLFLFGLVLIGLGIIGEYVWRSLEESRERPPFIIAAEYRKMLLPEKEERA